MSQVTRKNHFLPRWFLRRWSSDGETVRVFRLLVSHENVPQWSSQAISSAGARRDLYTLIDDGDETDRFEEWLTLEFEEPAVGAVESVVAGGRLSEDDYRRLSLLFAIQDLRTPRRPG